FINRQDGRMRGTIEEGVWMEMNEIRKLRVEAGWIWKISPRSTVAWYEVEKSYGVYPSGVSETGVKSSYAGHIRSEGVGLLGLSWSPAKNVQFQFWEQYAENVFNTALFRSDWKVPVSPDVHLISGLMVVRQDALNDGGNPDPAKAYIRKGSRAQVFSGRAGAGIRKFEFTFNYTRILDDGRFLMPREWGREPFYTFMPRERNEGFADVHAVNVSAGASLLNGRLKPSLSYGHFYLPDVKDAKRNKYGMPAYRQLNAEVRYAFSGYLKGMALQFLMVYKGEMGETYGEYRYVFNKVNMLNWNVMVDYKF
ncbi:MAG: OprD family outer membrane porin, partial [Bacteroidia bacterium]|nr:OprD family outer membrane porin [Bacteroidia bacterium]